jgi:hypothetical protein
MNYYYSRTTTSRYLTQHNPRLNWIEPHAGIWQ